MNSKKFFALVNAVALSATLAAFAPFAAAQKQQPPAGSAPKPFTLPRKETFTLKNGTQVTLVPYGSIPKVTVSAVVLAGNINETAEQVWLADLLGELMKEGTTTRSGEAVAQEAARMGGSLSIGVTPDQTSVSADVLSESGPALVALIAEVLQRPALPASELERLKANFVRNLSIQRSQPGSLAQERFSKLLYADHPYGRIFPTEEMIKNFQIADVQKFYKDNFGAARTHVYVAGRFDAAAMRRSITQTFGAWARGTAPVENIPKAVAVRKIHLIDRPGAPQSTLYLGLPVVDPSHKDFVALSVTNSLLGGSFASRITSNIREQKGYTYSPNSSISTHYRDAYWVQVADVTTAVTGPSLKEIFYEIDRLQKEPPTVAELQGIKNYRAGVFTIQNSSRAGIIGQLAFLDLHKLPDTYLTNYVQNVLAVTPQDVQRMARQYLKSEQMAIVVVGDKAQVTGQLTPYGEVIN
ncbi:MAG: zinc protease [Pyrinomonadaceae bacterium]|jgi:predicted Zn-dependent peptidase|nr:zinc protease [Pyrinomonadaceae bacterium]